MKYSIFLSVFLLLLTFVNQPAIATSMKKENNKLVVLWASGDRDVAEKSCLMYAHAAKVNGWFDEVVLIVWGSSARLLAEDPVLQEKVRKMGKDSVVLEACIACADQLGVTEQLLELDIDVKGMGIPLTDYLKEGYHVLTY